MEKIKELTEDQKAKLDVFRDKWIEIGLSTETNREKSEAAIDKAYEIAKLTPPEIKIWEGSPYAGVVKAARLKKFGDVDSEGEVTKEEIRSQLYKACYGTHDAPWFSFYDFFREECNIDLPELEGLIEGACHHGWWWPFEKVVIITPKPEEIHLDEEGRLHNESGMALRYPDGWGIYAWHGIRVPDRLIEDPSSYTGTEILEERNVEIRRCMLEKVGMEVLEDQASCVSRDDRGELYRIELENDDPIVFVKVQNSSAEPDGSYRQYYLRVPADQQTATQAIEWTFELEEEQYNPVQET